jgi:murein DD-endopeptidase MepM/ murein hydrolase activator NlpD
MELTQVKQLKLNVSNINSFLKKSNKNYNAIKKSNQRIVSRQVKQDKLKSKEKSVEKKPTLSSPLKTVKDVAKSSMGLFDKILNFGGLLLTGILLNALPSIKEKIDKFKEDNKEVIDNVVSTLTVVKDFAVDLFNSFTGPYAEEGSLDWLGKFDESGILRSGVLKEIEKSFDFLGGIINDIDKALGGEGKIGNALITGQRVLAKKGGKTGVLNQTTGEFTEREFTQEEQERFEQNKSGSRPDTVTEDRTDVPLEMKKGHYYFPLPGGQFSGESGQYYGAGRSYGGHAGIDLTESPPFGPKPNIDVVAMVGGEVLSEKYVGGKRYLSGMMIKGNDGNDQRYLHMTPMVSPGDSVKAGQKIGELVDMTYVTGNIDETHLHFEVYKRGQGRHLSPHKVYPKFFGSPRSAPRSIDTRERASGGNMAKISRLSNNNNRLASLNSSMGEDGSITYIYAVQPVIT